MSNARQCSRGNWLATDTSKHLEPLGTRIPVNLNWVSEKSDQVFMIARTRQFLWFQNKWACAFTVAALLGQKRPRPGAAASNARVYS
ncbi:MAG: hypothetical protein ABI585_08570, partial [Betaproteobacteria bacterium]